MNLLELEQRRNEASLAGDYNTFYELQDQIIWIKGEQIDRWVNSGWYRGPCFYCGSWMEGNHCEKCGAPLRRKK